MAVFYSYIKGATNWSAGILDLENNAWERSEGQEQQGLETKRVPLHVKECFIPPGYKSSQCPGLCLRPGSSPMLSCGCGMLSHAHITHVNQSPFPLRYVQWRWLFFFTLWVVSYSFQPTCDWMISPPPKKNAHPHTFFTLCQVSLPYLHKDRRKVWGR